jgi:hypothetical protein
MKEQVAEIEKWKNRIKGNKPGASLSSYAGDYTNNLYGNINIKTEGNGLRIFFLTKPGLEARLDYLDNGEWLMQYNNIEYGIHVIRFDISAGKVRSVMTKQNEFVEIDPYLFIKKW